MFPSNSPTFSPMTSTPTRDCTDSQGEYMTYNDKLRDCEWLDNGYNGAESTRKDLNCLHSQLGNECKYTCRLYNGCMGYLLSALPEYTNENDISVGHVCEDEEGQFMSNGGVPRECSWLEEDEETAPAKKYLNCGNPDVEPTELGQMCRASCAGYNSCTHSDGGVSGPHPLSGLIDDQAVDDGDFPTPFPTLWSSETPTSRWERCRDQEGEHLTHMGTYRACRWFNRDNIEEKLQLNCGITPIGKNCMASCPCDDMKPMNHALIPTLTPTEAGPSPTRGVFDESGQKLTLDTLADAYVSQKYYDVNDGESKRLNVAYEPGRINAKQSLLLFDLAFVANSFSVVSQAKLRIYLAVGSDSGGGIVLKKMSSTDWSEYDVTWSTTPGGDGTDEPIISFVDNLSDSDMWYDIDVTAAVQDALENNESKLGIRLAANEGDAIDIYFASKERLNEPPTLIVDSRTGDPTYREY